MKRFITSVALITALLAGGLMVATPVDTAAAACDAHGIGNKSKTNYTAGNTAYTVANSKATTTFDVVGGKNCRVKVTMVAWTAPNGTTGMPYSQQREFAHTTGTFSPGRHRMSVGLPECYYQVDTITGTKLTGSTGGPHKYGNRMVGYIHGGTTSCVKTPAPAPPEAVGGAPEAPAELVKTGPATNTAVGIVVVSVIAGYLFAQLRLRRHDS